MGMINIFGLGDEEQEKYIWTLYSVHDHNFVSTPKSVVTHMLGSNCLQYVMLKIHMCTTYIWSPKAYNNSNTYRNIQ